MTKQTLILTGLMAGLFFQTALADVHYFFTTGCAVTATPIAQNALAFFRQFNVFDFGGDFSAWRYAAAPTVSGQRQITVVGFGLFQCGN